MLYLSWDTLQGKCVCVCVHDGVTKKQGREADEGSYYYSSRQQRDWVSLQGLIVSKTFGMDRSRN